MFEEGSFPLGRGLFWNTTPPELSPDLIPRLLDGDARESRHRELVEGIESVRRSIVDLTKSTQLSERSAKILVSRNNSLSRENKELFSRIEELEEEMGEVSNLHRTMESLETLAAEEKARRQKAEERLQDLQERERSLQENAKFFERESKDLQNELLIQMNETVCLRKKIETLEWENQRLREENRGVLQDYEQYRELTDAEIEKLKDSPKDSFWTDVNLEFPEELFPESDCEILDFETVEVLARTPQ